MYTLNIRILRIFFCRIRLGLIGLAWWGVGGDRRQEWLLLSSALASSRLTSYTDHQLPLISISRRNSVSSISSLSKCLCLMILKNYCCIFSWTRPLEIGNIWLENLGKLESSSVKTIAATIHSGQITQQRSITKIKYKWNKHSSLWNQVEIIKNWEILIFMF